MRGRLFIFLIIVQHDGELGLSTVGISAMTTGPAHMAR